MTLYFIIGVFVIVVIFDIYALVKKKGTITSYFRKWFGVKNKDKGLPVIPYAIGAIVSHFGLPIDFSFIPGILALIIFILISLTVIIWNVVNRINQYYDLDDVSGFYYFMQNKWYLSMAVGVVVGSLWYY